MTANPAERDELERQIELLRAFEREYRTELRNYHLGRLQELELPGAKKNQMQITREWSELPGTNLRIRLRSSVRAIDGTSAWIEVDTR